MRRLWCPSYLRSPLRGRHPPSPFPPARVRVARAATARVSSLNAPVALTTTTTQRQRRSRHRRLATCVRLDLPRCNTRANQQRGRDEDLPGPSATLSRISSRARQRAPRFHRPGSHGRRRRWIRTVFTVVLRRLLSSMPRPRGVRASVARCRFVSRLGMTSVLRLGPARHAARVPFGSRTSFTLAPPLSLVSPPFPFRGSAFSRCCIPCRLIAPS